MDHVTERARSISYKAKLNGCTSINGNTEMDQMIPKITPVNSMDSILKIDQLLASDTVEVKYYHSENWHEPIAIDQW